jgi:hypothetical protein
VKYAPGSGDDAGLSNEAECYFSDNDTAAFALSTYHDLVFTTQGPKRE